MNTDDFDSVLEHFGVKGMRWGVRNSPSVKRRSRIRDRAEKKRRKTIETLAKVGRGEGKATEKLEAYLTLPYGAFSVARSGGLKKAATKRAKRLSEIETNLESGKGRARDYMSLVGSGYIEDFVPRNRRGR